MSVPTVSWGVLRASRGSWATPLIAAAAIGLSVFAVANTAAADDTVNKDVAAPVAKQSDRTSERERRRAERRRGDSAEKADGGAKTEDLTKFPKVAAEASTAPAQPKLECRTQEVTGSRMGKRICATHEQWAEADAQAAEAVRQMRSDVGNKAGIERPGANPFGAAVGR